MIAPKDIVLASKVSLLTYCHKHDLPIISSMGAGCKSDPTRIFIGDISSSTEDPLSRSTRRRLRALGVASGIPVVYSTEKPGPGKAQLLPLPEEEFQKGKVGEDAQGLKLGLSVYDVGYLVEEVYRGKSVLSGITTRLALVRWRKPEAGSTIKVDVEGQKNSIVRLGDLVCMTKEEANVHEREVVKGDKTPEQFYDEEIVELVESRLREEKSFEKYR
ncbi:hypothetical protein M7I_3962 [Glarea lozoyensis 74030]|uniref:Uncharacterized protein n=1 Tax=Glarea lozoyensis (strain ATCC 74030 / MF5533) TaxID=1104152 RepID=H0EMW3_GLAL7|nr:hypothetical protein M7I_3962 [Glarea lozoyensis 74030]